MSEHRDVARKTDVKEKVFKPRRRYMVGRLDQHIGRVRNRQKAALLQAGTKSGTM